MLLTRLAKICSELLRTPQQILDLDSLPPALRPRNRLRTHDPAYVDGMVHCLARFFKWAEDIHELVLPASAELVLRFLRHLHETVGMPIPTVLFHITAINSYHHTNDFTEPVSRELAMYKSALKAEHTRVKATAIDTLTILAMIAVAKLENRLRAARDIAILLFSFAGAFRPSETCAVRVEDLDFRPQGLQVYIPSSKNNYRKPRFVTITYASSPEHCPIHALKRWLAESGITEGPVFRRISRFDKLYFPGTALSHGMISLIIRRYARQLHLPGRISAYSLRRGCATTAAGNGVSLETLQRHLRHEHEQTTQEYVDLLPVSYEQSVTPLVLP